MSGTGMKSLGAESWDWGLQITREGTFLAWKAVVGWKAWARVGLANVSKIILILTRLIRERELARDGGQSLRNSREVCPPENIFCLVRALNWIVSLWSANICENVLLLFLFIPSLTALAQVTKMSLLVPKMKASCLTCRCLYSAMQWISSLLVA